ncbi:MAG: endonuclease III domain-containing protein [Lentisphaerota bacterium]
MRMKQRQLPLMDIYQAMFDAWGPQHWWPGETQVEIIVGAVLTQNTAWTNVEKAIDRLKKARVLSLSRLHDLPLQEVAELIRPAGYYNIKARRIRSFTTMVTERFGGRLEKLLALNTVRLREVLLSVNGIGPETADSILLYVARRPVFVVDAYTRRFMERHDWLSPKAAYDDVAALCMRNIPLDVKLFNEYHALIVHLGKYFCKKNPRCGECPLRKWLKQRKGMEEKHGQA